MIDEIAKKLGQAQTKHPGRFITGFLILVAAMIPGIFLLVGNVEASLEQVLPPSVESVDTMNDARVQYQADMLHVVVATQGAVVDIREAQDYIQELKQRIELVPTVAHVRAGTTKQFVSDDLQLAVIDIQADTGANSQRIDETINAVQAAIDASKASNPGVSTQITGFAAIDQATFSTIMSDFLKITAIAMALILAIVYFTFRTIRYTAIPMAAVMVALITTMGLTGYLSITITVVTMVAAAMILGLGIDFGIHTIHSYQEYRETNKPNTAAKKTLQELFRAQLGASMTTGAGFLALGLGVLPAMADLGVVLAIGVFTTFIAATMLLPPLLLLTENTT